VFVDQPKAWIMAIAASTYAPAQLAAAQDSIYRALFALINYPTCPLWILLTGLVAAP
jgi:hypothetical protein